MNPFLNIICIFAVMRTFKPEAWLPTTKKEVEAREWDYIDVILFSGDAYVDHPSFGAAVIGRTLEAMGLRVAIVPQPDWRGDYRDFKKLGAPRLFFGVSAGAMDSMINHYTANKRLRSDDAYTPDRRAGMRPVKRIETTVQWSLIRFDSECGCSGFFQYLRFQCSRAIIVRYTSLVVI